MARQHTVYVQTLNALAKKQNNIGIIQKETDQIARIDIIDGLHQKSVNRTNPGFLYPELSLMNLLITDIEQEPQVMFKDQPTITKNPIFIAEPANISPNPTVINEKPVINSLELPVTAVETVITSPEPPLITENPEITSPMPPIATIKPEIISPKPPEITADPTIVPSRPPVAAIESEIISPKPPEIADNPTITSPEPPPVTDESITGSPNQPITTEDSNEDSDKSDSNIEETPSEEESNNTSFLYNGFLCNSSGLIIGCQDVAVIDGVLCIPANETCTGIAADALVSLGAQVYELYIPANIITIEEGALNGLTELFYIEVHPDNPVYASNEGLLYEK